MFELCQAAGRRVAAWIFALGISAPAGATVAEPPQTTPPPGAVAQWVTTFDARQRLARQADLRWNPSASAAAIEIVVDPSRRYQEIDGFGGTITTDAIWRASPEVRDEVMRLLFSRTTGIGLNNIRLVMGLSGLNGPFRTYNDLPPGETDPELTRFSLDGDRVWKLPMLREARALNPDIRIMGTPWSAPAWMKDSGELGRGKLRPEFYETYARYFVRWLEEMRAEGFDVAAVTMQNEPQHEPGWYQGMRMEVQDQIDFALKLGPAVRDAGFSTRIIAWDHNCDDLEFPIKVLAHPEARRWIDGAAFHAYAGTTADIARFAAAHPDKAVYFTEQTGVYPENGFGGSVHWHVRHCFIVPALHGSRNTLMWQLGRRVSDLQGDRPFVRISPDGRDYELHAEYYETGHFSKFVRPGARRIEATRPPVHEAPLVVAYENADGSRAIVALNERRQAVAFTVREGARRVAVSLPAGALMTLHWSDAPPAPVVATSVPAAVPHVRLRPEATAVEISWLPVHGATRYVVMRSDSLDGPFRAIATVPSGTRVVDTAPRVGVPQHYVVAAINSVGQGPMSPPRTVVARGNRLSGGWVQTAIGGANGHAGNAGDNGAVVAVAGEGRGAVGRADSFRFTHLAMPGDGEISARLAELHAEPGQRARAGLMLRAGEGADAAFFAATLVKDRGVVVEARDTAGEERREIIEVRGPFAPRWLRLARIGDNVVAEISEDGIRWRELAPPQRVALGAQARAGLTVASWDDPRPALAVFESISAPGLPPVRPPAPEFLRAWPGAASVGLSWAQSAGATRYQIMRSTEAGPWSVVGVTDAPFFVDATAESGRGHRYVVRAGGPGGASQPSAVVSAPASGASLPAGWFFGVIGEPLIRGDVEWSAERVVVRGGGLHVWGRTDEAVFAAYDGRGDGSITVRVNEVESENPLAKLGLMVRATMAADAPHVFLHLSPAGELKLETRASAGGTTRLVAQESVLAPVELRLTRSGGGIVAEWREPGAGAEWRRIGETLALERMGPHVLAGLAVNAHGAQRAARAVFDAPRLEGFGVGQPDAQTMPAP